MPHLWRNGNNLHFLEPRIIKWREKPVSFSRMYEVTIAHFVHLEVKNRVEGLSLDPILFLVTARTRIMQSPGSAIVS